MIPGLTALITSYPRPRRSIAPGAKFSIITSAHLARRLTSSSPRGSFRLIAAERLFELYCKKYSASASGKVRPSDRPGSPEPGFSILTTSAPSQANASVQDGPASNWVRSRILRPARQFSPLIDGRSLLPWETRIGRTLAHLVGTWVLRVVCPKRLWCSRKRHASLARRCCYRSTHPTIECSGGHLHRHLAQEGDCSESDHAAECASLSCVHRSSVWSWMSVPRGAWPRTKPTALFAPAGEAVIDATLNSRTIWLWVRPAKKPNSCA